MKNVYFNSKFARFILPKKYACFTFFGKTFFKENKDFIKENAINHEKIHAVQQKECLFLGFIISTLILTITQTFWISLITFLFFFQIVYGVELFILLLKNKFKFNKYLYKKISFELEASENENDMLYLKKERQPFSWINYIGC